MQPFEKFRIVDKYEEFKKEIAQDLELITDVQIQSNSIEVLADSLLNRYILDPVVIDTLPSKTDMFPTKIKYNERYGNGSRNDLIIVNGIKLIHVYGFQGSQILFHCNAEKVLMGNYPEIILNSNNTFEISAEDTEVKIKNDEKLILKLSIERQLGTLKEFIGYCNVAVEKLNVELHLYTKKLIEGRKNRLELLSQLKEKYEIPLVPREPNQLKTITLKSRKISLKEDKENKSEYCISDKSYDEILHIIKHHCATFERTPKVFLKHDEEELRDILLAALNCIFMGSASGETFRQSGHSDICIEFENRAAFVAECKFWSGEKSLSDAIDQLFSYTTWRDIKLSLIVFSKRKDFFEVTEKAHESLSKHQDNIRYERVSRNLFRNTLKSRINKDQHIVLNTIIVNLYERGIQNGTNNN